MSEDQLTVLKDIRRILKKILQMQFRVYKEANSGLVFNDLPTEEK